MTFRLLHQWLGDMRYESNREYFVELVEKDKKDIGCRGVKFKKVTLKKALTVTAMRFGAGYVHIPLQVIVVSSQFRAHHYNI